MRKKVPIIRHSERVVLSDVLPYETPLIFSNRYFYKYLIKRKRCLKNAKFRSKHRAFSEIEKLLFTNQDVTSPFVFHIRHKTLDFRTLSLIHPSNQLKVLDFYEKYSESILYCCSLSPFSIRRPSKIARFSFYNDLLHKKNQDGDFEHAQVEEEDNEYENLKSFFTYQKYSNIHKFFESYQFHRSEKKYRKLLKVDISKCFDSIYTHTVSWAVFNKSIVKDNIPQSLKTFPGEFDYLMQKLNANETNGIVIGPEFSRIFAELILQQIDRNLYDRLKSNDFQYKSLIHKVDYEIFRYIDDYFIFYNDESDSQKILSDLKLCLGEYKMYINENKSVTYEKPIITEISLAKQKISDLFKDHLKLKESLSKDDENNSTIYFSSNSVITRFKSIVKETSVSYKDIMNYSLAVLDKKTAKLVDKFLKEKKTNPDLDQKEFEKGFLEILDVSFFLYSVSPKVNSTIKLCLIIDKIIRFLKKNKSNSYIEPFSFNYKHNIFKKIADEIFLILQINKTKSETQVESLYLLIALSQLGREYRLNLKILSSYFHIDTKSDGSLVANSNLNYFSITVLLFYIKNIHQYRDIKYFIKDYIIEKFQMITIDNKWKTDSESVILLMDILTCPYLNNSLEMLERKEIKDYIIDIENSLLRTTTSDGLVDYISSVKKLFQKFKSHKTTKCLKDKIIRKFESNLEDYLNEINLRTGFEVYAKEETLMKFVDYLKNNFQDHIDIYKYKKQLLSLIGITENQTHLIQQEKFWFIKWTDFDFGMELQAKRSQEVY